MFRCVFLPSVCTVPATTSPAPLPCQSHAHTLSFPYRGTPTTWRWEEMPGWHFDMLFAADSFRIITSRLPWNFLISLSLIVSPALPGWGTTPHPHPPLLIPSSFSLLISLADLTAVVLNFLPGYFQRIHLVLLRVRGWWEQCSHRHQIFENKKTHLGKSGFVFLSVLGEAYIYCPHGYIVCVEAEKGSINNNDKQLNNNQHVNNNCVSLQVGNK